MSLASFSQTLGDHLNVKGNWTEVRKISENLQKLGESLKCGRAVYIRANGINVLCTDIL